MHTTNTTAITDIRPWGKKKSKIHLSDKRIFWLYNNELDKYAIVVGTDYGESDFFDDIQKVLLKRAADCILNAIARSDKPESQLRQTLRRMAFPQDIIDAAIAATKDYYKIDDGQYAAAFLTARAGGESLRSLKQKLYGKGIDPSVIEHTVQEIFPDDAGADKDMDAIRAELTKKLRGRDISELSDIDKRKLYGYLQRKGFGYSLICDCLKVGWLD